MGTNVIEITQTGDYHNIIRLTGLPEAVITIPCLALLVVGIFFLSLIPLLGLDPKDWRVFFVLNDFGYVIKVKENAPELLRRALSRLPVDLVMTGIHKRIAKAPVSQLPPRGFRGRLPVWLAQMCISLEGRSSGGFSREQLWRGHARHSRRLDRAATKLEVKMQPWWCV